VGHQLGSQPAGRWGLAGMEPVVVAELALAWSGRVLGFFFGQSSEGTRMRCHMGGLADLSVGLTVEEPVVLHISGSLQLGRLEPSMKPGVFALRCPTSPHCGSLICIYAGIAGPGLAL